MRIRHTLLRHGLSAPLLTGMLVVAIVCASVPPAIVAATTTPAAPSRGSQVYATNFDPASFNQTVVGSSASLTQGPGPSLVCGVGSGGSKMIASVKQSIAEPTVVWAEYDIKLDSMNGGYVASLYFEGLNGNHRHLHIDFGTDQITLRDPNYNNEGPLVNVPNLNSGATIHFVVVDASPRYMVYVDGSQVIDYTDGFAASTPGGFGLDCASNNNGTGSDSITNFALYRVSGSCPSGWSCADIGAPAPAGTQWLQDNTWSVVAGGSDIWNNADSFRYVWQPFNGGSITARVTGQTNTSSWAKAGLMLRATTDPGSPDYQVLVTPGNGVVVQYRGSQGGATVMAASKSGGLPLYVGLGASGRSVTAYTSSDGLAWTAISGSTVSLSTAPALAGVAVTSHNTGSTSSATVDGVALSQSPTPCPRGWSCADIGAPSPVGSQTYSGGTWTIKGGGSDIQGTADHFHYAWRSLAGDGGLSARVVSESNTNAWAKAGLMIRTTSDAGAPNYAVFLTPGNGVTVQWRGAQSGGTSWLKVTGSAPVYLKVRRTGTSFSAYTSGDGSTWTLIPGSTQTLSISGTLIVGLAVTSHSNGTLCSAAFSNVTSF